MNLEKPDAERILQSLFDADQALEIKDELPNVSLVGRAGATDLTSSPRTLRWRRISRGFGIDPKEVREGDSINVEDEDHDDESYNVDNVNLNDKLNVEENLLLDKSDLHPPSNKLNASNLNLNSGPNDSMKSPPQTTTNTS